MDSSELALRKILDEAVEKKVDSVRIPPGTYRIGTDPRTSGMKKCHLFFQDVENLEIDGSGVTLIMVDALSSNGVIFQDCAGVTIRGIVYDCEEVSFSQGAIQDVGPNGRWYDMKIDSGYVNDVERFLSLERTGKAQQGLRPVSFFDPETLGWKYGSHEPKLETIEQRGSDVWRLHAVERCWHENAVDLGDRVVVSFRGPSAWSCFGCRDMTFENVTVHHSPSIAFHETNGEGGMTLRGCKVTPPPGSNRLLSSVGGSYIHRNIRRGPIIENCLAERMHDDGTNIHGHFDRVFDNASGNEVLIIERYDFKSQPGDRLEFVSRVTGDSLGVYLIESVEEAFTVTPEVSIEYNQFNGRRVYRVRLETPAPVEKLDGVISVDYQGNGYVVRNCEFGASRYRSILAKGQDGLIEGNRVTGCGYHAISLTPHTFRESGFIKNVVVRNNTIRHTGITGPRHDAHGKEDWGVGIDVTLANPWRNVDGPNGFLERLPEKPIFENITIEGNVLLDVMGDGIVVRHGRNVTIRNNRLKQIGKRNTLDDFEPQAIRVEDSENVCEEGNSID